MIYHTVLFKIKPEVGGGEADRLIAGLQGLKGKIPGLELISAGKNFSERSQGYSVVLVTAFKTREALGEYQNHPDHKAVLRDLVRPNVENVAVGDFEESS